MRRGTEGLVTPQSWTGKAAARGRAWACAAVLALLASSPTHAGEVVEYYHLDAIGNVRAVTNAAGQVVERHDYLPFGEECTTGPCASNSTLPAAQPRKFTGKERDAETGLDYFGARYYGSRIGRFTTVDPVYTWQENFVDPQRWNRYAYARNNPLRYTDPDGKFILPALVVVGAAAVYAILASPDIANAPGPKDPLFKSDQSGKLIANAALAVTSLKAIFPTEGLSPPDQRDDPKEVAISRSRSPQAAQHIEEAQAAGHPDVVTIDRSRTVANRTESLRGVARQPGMDRDEYPPACCAEGGAGASVRSIPRSDNRSAGGQLGRQLQGVADGTRVRIKTKNE
jgi:RHS repeat-associated protein